MGSLAIIGDDTSGIAQNILKLSVPNAVENCIFAVSSDGTWAETANYWYFGITGAAEMTASLLTATGSDYGLLKTNENLSKTGLYHMYVTGPGSLFAYGDHGPNKFSHDRKRDGVCNSGLTMGSLAIIGDDTSGIAQNILKLSVPNAVENCIFAVSSDGTWAETANYWYFGITGAAEMTASLLTATGSDYGLLKTNENLSKTGLYHMYVTGPGSLFAYGDHGPNKFSTTANAMASATAV